jgi:N-acylneuraminate cytidylyltransferase
MSQVAVIPARGGSKRIPKKNIKLFHGKPIITYAIEKCLETEIFSSVIVSTDDVSIAKVAEANGAEVFFRTNSYTASDLAPVISVVQEIIYAQSFEENTDSVCCVFPCTPLLSSEFLVQGHKILMNNDVDFVFPVFNPGLSIERSLFINQSGYLQMSNKKFENSPTNTLTVHLFDAGQYYWAKTKTWVTSESILGSKNIPQIVGKLSVVDIDNEDDWRLAEILFSTDREGENGV